MEPRDPGHGTEVTSVLGTRIVSSYVTRRDLTHVQVPVYGIPVVLYTILYYTTLPYHQQLAKATTLHVPATKLIHHLTLTGTDTHAHVPVPDDPARGGCLVARPRRQLADT